MRRNKIIEAIENEQMKTDIPEFHPGDTVIVQVRVAEGGRDRNQAFEGVVIGKRKRGLNSSFTVRKISHGVGVERSFQTHSPAIAGDRSETPWRRAPGEAVLPAKSFGSRCANPREGLKKSQLVRRSLGGGYSPDELVVSSNSGTSRLGARGE